MTSRFSDRTFFNLVTEVLYVVIAALIGLLMVPFYIDELGMFAYAIIPLATSVTSYVMIFSDSFCSAINRYFVISLEGDDMDDANITYSTSLRAILRMAIVVMPMMAFVSFLTPMIFDIAESSAHSVRILFFAVLWSAIIVACGSCFNNALIAENKLSTINTIRILYLVVQVSMILALFISDKPSLEYIGLAYLSSALVYLILSYVVMKRDYPELRFRMSNYSSSRMKEIGNLGIWSIINRVSNLMFLQASLIITNMMLGAVEEGNFSLAVSMVSMIGTGCMAIANVFYPYYYNLYSKGDMNGIVDVAVTGMRFMGVLLAFPLAYICVFSEQILSIWVGSEFAFVKDVIWIMFAFLISQSVMTVMDAIPTIMLKVRGIASISLVMGFVNILLAVVLCTFTDLGIIGIGIAWAVSMTIRSCILYPLYLSRIIGFGSSRLFSSELMSLGLFVVSVVTLQVISQIVVVNASIASILITFIPLFLVYIILFTRYVFNDNDKKFLLASMPGSISRLFGHLMHRS